MSDENCSACGDWDTCEECGGCYDKDCVGICECDDE